MSFQWRDRYTDNITSLICGPFSLFATEMNIMEINDGLHFNRENYKIIHWNSYHKTKYIVNSSFNSPTSQKQPGH